jgi:hypothetical protein
MNEVINFYLERGSFESCYSLTLQAMKKFSIDYFSAMKAWADYITLLINSD